MSGSELYRKLILRDGSFDGINERVWRGTPWILDAYTKDAQQFDLMSRWCWDRYGPPAWPFSDNPRPGRWMSGGATVFGWTWWGFATEAEMHEFEAAWPSPPQTPGDGDE